MKTDRELLELAARAAGLDLEWCDFWQCMAKNLGVIDGFDRHTCWNPLKDGGDALRLAVNLREQFGTDIAACFGIGRFAEWAPDPHAATLRAIVQAAAEIQLQKERNQ